MSETRKDGASGKSMRHLSPVTSRKDAKEAAREAAKGNPPIHHEAHKPGQHPHYHPADEKGDIIKDGSHYRHAK
jgi:hypothetical protein